MENLQDAPWLVAPMPQSQPVAPVAAAPDQGAQPAMAAQQELPDAPWAQPESKHTFGLADTWPARLVKGIYNAVTLPGDVAQGNVSMTGEDGHTNPEVINRSAELASLASPMSPAARLGVGWAGALNMEKAPGPSPEMLKNAATVGYDKARNLGVELPASNISGYADRVANELLNKHGITPEQATNTYKTLDRLRDSPPDATVTVPNLDALRENFGGTASNFNPNASRDQFAAVLAKERLADHLASLTDKDAIRGPASTLASITKEANGNYSAFKTDEDVGDALYKADLQNRGAASGKNLDNKTRQAFVRILTNDKAGAGLRDNERQAAEDIVTGSPSADWGRTVGNVLGGGGGMGRLHAAATGGSAGFAAAGPIGAAIGAIGVPAVGHFLKKFADQSTQGKVEALREMIRSRSPLGATMPERIASPVTPRQLALARSLILGSGPQQ